MSQGWPQGQNGNGTRPQSMAVQSTGEKSKASKFASTMARMDIGKKGKSGGASEPEDGARFDARFKVVLLGDSGVGKTSLIRAAIGESFNPTMISTIGRVCLAHFCPTRQVKYSFSNVTSNNSFNSSQIPTLIGR